MLLKLLHLRPIWIKTKPLEQFRGNRRSECHTLLKSVNKFLPAVARLTGRYGRNSIQDVRTQYSCAFVSFGKIGTWKELRFSYVRQLNYICARIMKMYDILKAKNVFGKVCVLSQSAHRLQSCYWSDIFWTSRSILNPRDWSNWFQICNIIANE